MNLRYNIKNLIPKDSSIREDCALVGSLSVGISFGDIMIIYKVTNKDNGKVYIGLTTTTLHKRKFSHLRKVAFGSNGYFHNALRKYGSGNFSWNIIRICYTLKSLNIWEQYYILYYNSMENGYNMTTGGKHWSHSKKTKIKMRKSAKKWHEQNQGALKGKNNPNYGKGKKGKDNPNYGSKRSLKTKQKMRYNNIGKNNPMYGVHLLGENAPMFNKKHTENTIKKMKISQRIAQRKRRLREKEVIIKNELIEKGVVNERIFWHRYTKYKD